MMMMMIIIVIIIICWTPNNREILPGNTLFLCLSSKDSYYCGSLNSWEGGGSSCSGTSSVRLILAWLKKRGALILQNYMNHFMLNNSSRESRCGDEWLGKNLPRTREVKKHWTVYILNKNHGGISGGVVNPWYWLVSENLQILKVII